MIAFARPSVVESCVAGASCTVTPLPEPGGCPDCDLDSSPCPDDFTITFSGLPDGMACDVCEVERLKRELITLLKREGRL
jgi:hypothetical protein